MRRKGEWTREWRMANGAVAGIAVISDPPGQHADDGVGERERRQRQHIGHSRTGTEGKAAEGLHVDAPGDDVARVAWTALGEDEEQVEMADRYHRLVDDDESEGRRELRQRDVEEAPQGIGAVHLGRSMQIRRNRLQ